MKLLPASGVFRVMGARLAAGMTIGPAPAFGYIAARHAALAAA